MKVLYREMMTGSCDLLTAIHEKDGCKRYQWREDVSLHFYISSAPCGNATLKRWARSRKEVFMKDLDEWSWPNDSHISDLMRNNNNLRASSQGKKCLSHSQDSIDKHSPREASFPCSAAWEGQVASLVKRDPDVAAIAKLETRLDQASVSSSTVALT